mgnify:FL=1
MNEQTTSIYEGLFLFPQSASASMQQAVDHVNTLLERAEATVLAFSKWDERRLAYDIQGNKRGVFFLVYFEADRDRLSSLERDCNLSEQLLRSMITRADHVPTELVEGSEGRAQLEDEIRMRAEPEHSEHGRSVIERAGTADAPAPEATATAEAPEPEAAPAAEEAPAAEAEAPEASEAPEAPRTDAEDA